MLLYGPKDVQTAKFLILNGNENEEQPPEERARLQSRDLERLDQMVGYCKTTSCLRRYLLDYFGEHLAEPCGHCSSCQGNFVERDITVEAQKILSGVARVERMYPYGLGVNQVIHMLRGSRNQRVLGLKLDTLPTYGILREVPREQVQIYVDCLVERGYLVVTKTEFPVVHLTAQARRVLFEGERVLASLAVPTREAPALPQTEAAEPVGPLMGELKALRTRLAQAEGRARLHHFLQCHLGGYGGKIAHHHGGPVGGLRRGRSQGGPLWRGIPGCHPGVFGNLTQQGWKRPWHSEPNSAYKRPSLPCWTRSLGTRLRSRTWWTGVE